MLDKIKQLLDKSENLKEGWFQNKKEIRDNILKFDIEPNATDITFEAWLLRLSLYGKTSFHYKDTQTKTDKNVDLQFFLYRIVDRDLNRALGTWKKEKQGNNTVVFWRTFLSNNGTEQSEELTVTVDFRPEVENLLKNYK